MKSPTTVNPEKINVIAVSCSSVNLLKSSVSRSISLLLLYDGYLPRHGGRHTPTFVVAYKRTFVSDPIRLFWCVSRGVPERGRRSVIPHSGEYTCPRNDHTPLRRALPTRPGGAPPGREKCRMKADLYLESTPGRPDCIVSLSATQSFDGHMICFGPILW